MIQKIRELMQVKDEIATLNNSVSENSKAAGELKMRLEELTAKLVELKETQHEMISAFRDDLNVIRNLRDDFSKELYEFKLLKGQMQRKILDKFEEELQKDLNINRETLKKDIDDYSDLRQRAQDILTKMNLTASEIAKFTEISRSIKKEDFELTKFARHLIDMDKEKLELMRKIDTLERLVSKIRRNQVVR